MNGDTGVVSKRRLAAYFCDSDYETGLSNDMIQDDEGDRPQLVNTQRIYHASSPPPTRLDRLLFHMRIKPRSPKALQVVDHRNEQALAEAHGFISRNYRSGDQVILVADFTYGADYIIKWMEMLASHLHDGTTPGKPSKVQPRGRQNNPGQRVPIYAVAVIGA
ncbi:unnamed protein product [Rhizoctonia solani]|uniref:Uncharacterized protein n=1 Tax=Rhizoctonia solani TaxID=456999 RepID=A0A8H3ANY5_9AGAM|nr:unnamed protein product [Rhizoctonia solani]